MDSTSVVSLIGSQAAIVSTVVALVAITKRLAGNVAVLCIVPAWVYAVAYAIALTVASHRLGYLTGNLPDLLVSAVFLAASASGFRDWMTQGNLTRGIEATTVAREARNDRTFRKSVGVTGMKWWRVIKVALAVGMKVGRVKEAKRVGEIVDAIDVVIAEAAKPEPTPAMPAQKGQ